MRRVVELQDVEGVRLEFDDRTLVIVNIAVVWSGKNRDNNGELARPVPFVHLITVELSFVCAQNGK